MTQGVSIEPCRARRIAPRRAGHRGLARHRPGRGARLRRVGGACGGARPHAGRRSRNSTTRSGRCGPREPAATTLVPMDLRDFAAIDRLGEALYRRWGRLDAFVGNAGTLWASCPPCTTSTPKTWDDVMAVNVTANWRLIRSLDPLLRRSAAGRVAFITSGVASRAELRAYWGPVCDFQGGARRPRPHLRRRDPEHVEHPRHAHQPRDACGPRCAPRRCPARIPRRCGGPRSWRRRSPRSARPNGPKPENCTTFPRIAS